MTKEELVASVSKALRTSVRKAEKIVDTVMIAMAEKLEQGAEFQVPGVATIQVRNQQRRGQKNSRIVISAKSTAEIGNFFARRNGTPSDKGRT